MGRLALGPSCSRVELTICCLTWKPGAKTSATHCWMDGITMISLESPFADITLWVNFFMMPLSAEEDSALQWIATVLPAPDQSPPPQNNVISYDRKPLLDIRTTITNLEFGSTFLLQRVGRSGRSADQAVIPGNRKRTRR